MDKVSPQENPSVLEFAGYRLDAASRRLTDPNGSLLDLRPRVFDTLLVLVQNAGEPVSRSALMSAIWPNTVVDENNLNQSVASLRKALGKKPDGTEFIQTLPGRGYQFTEAVHLENLEQDDTAEDDRRGELASERIKLAVSSFDVLSNDPSHEQLTKGIQKALVTSITKFPEFDVHAANGADGPGETEPTGDGQYSSGIRYRMEGDLLVSGARYRANVQLVDIVSGATVWANRFDNTYADEIEAIDKIVQSILFEFYPTFHHYEKKLASQKRFEDMTAWEVFKVAVNPERDRANFEQLDRALRYLDRALELDPDFAEAHGIKPMFLAMRQWWSPAGNGEEVDQQMRFHAERALALGAQQPWTIMNVSYGYGMLGDYELAAKLAAQAASMQPDSLQFQLAKANSQFYATGNADKHIPRLRELLESLSDQNPMRPSVIAVLTCAFAYTGKWEEAIETFDLDVSIPLNLPEPSVVVLACCNEVGQMDRADSLMRQVVSSFPAFDGQHYCRRNFDRWLAHPAFETRREGLAKAVTDVERRVKD